MSQPPENCQSMDEVRAGVDALDEALIELLARRFAYMRAAARIKPSRELVRDEARKAQVIANVRRLAAMHGVPEALAGQLWDVLVEGSIAYELEAWNNGRDAP